MNRRTVGLLRKSDEDTERGLVLNGTFSLLVG